VTRKRSRLGIMGGSEVVEARRSLRLGGFRGSGWLMSHGSWLGMAGGVRGLVNDDVSGGLFQSQ
jgi:hypothetical protein